LWQVSLTLIENFFMEPNQPTANPTYVPAPRSRGLFGTGIPSSLAFVIGLLLFLMPLSEIKCGDTAILNKSGLSFALGKDWKPASGLGGKDMMGDMESKTKGKKEGNAPYALMGAFALGLLGLLISFAGTKTGSRGGIIFGVLAAAAMIAFMILLKDWFKTEMAKENKTKTGDADSLGLDKMNIVTLSMTVWFYVSVAAFILAAVFSYLRSRTTTTR
jgi:amino acid transporter